MQEEVPNQLTLRTSSNVAKPTKSSLDKRRRYANEAEAAPQFCRWFVGLADSNQRILAD